LKFKAKILLIAIFSTVDVITSIVDYNPIIYVANIFLIGRWDKF